MKPVRHQAWKAVAAAAALVAGGAVAASDAQASLLGAQVNGAFASFFGVNWIGPATVGAGIELSDTDHAGRTVSLDVDATGFSLLFQKPSENGDFSYGDATLSLSFTGTNITGVTYGSMVGLDYGNPAAITFGSDSIFVDFGFLALNYPFPSTSASIRWDVTSTALEQVPEPASLALFGLAVAGLGLVRRRSV